MQPVNSITDTNRSEAPGRCIALSPILSPQPTSAVSITHELIFTHVLRHVRRKARPFLKALDEKVWWPVSHAQTRERRVSDSIPEAKFCRRPSPPHDWLCSRRSSHHDFPWVQPKPKSFKLHLRDCSSDVGKQAQSTDRRCANMLSWSKPAVSASAGPSFEMRPLRVTTRLRRRPFAPQSQTRCPERLNPVCRR